MASHNTSFSLAMSSGHWIHRGIRISPKRNACDCQNIQFCLLESSHSFNRFLKDLFNTCILLYSIMHIYCEKLKLKSFSLHKYSSEITPLVPFFCPHLTSHCPKLPVCSKKTKKEVLPNTILPFFLELK